MTRRERMVHVLMIALFASCSYCGTRVYAKSARVIAEGTFPSVGTLLMYDAQDQPISLGSGFFIGEGVLATNVHVIEGAVRGHLKIVDRKEQYNIVGFVAIDPNTDLVLLKIDKVKAPALALGDSDQTAVGDEVFAVGNPQGLEGTFSKGIVSGVRTFSNHRLLQITAPLSPGSSGGPILNTNGEVVGVSVATFSKGQNLNFAIPVTCLKQLMRDMKSPTPLSANIGKHKPEGSLLSAIGPTNSGGVVGTQFRCYISTYYFSLRNNLRHPVGKVACLVIFYDKDEQPVDVDIFRLEDVVPPGLAKRITRNMHEGVFELVREGGWREGTPQTKIECRVLDFQVMEGGDLL